VTVSFYGPSIEAWAGGAWGVVADMLVWIAAYNLGPDAYASPVTFVGSMLAFFVVAFAVTDWLTKRAEGAESR
jgi:hypothetical protein